MRLFVKSAFRTMSMLGVAAIMGVTGATSTTCGVWLAYGIGTGCALPLVWFIGFPIAIIAALIFGLPLALLFWKFRLTRWWQFGITGFICAVPVWIELAGPFTSVRWGQSGLYDSLNYLGSGIASGLAYWWISQKVAIRDGIVQLALARNKCSMASKFPYFLPIEPRPLTTDEYAIVECLVSDLDEKFKQQLPKLTVVGRCGCGNCPTIFFQPNQKDSQEHDLISYQGTDSNRNLVAAVLLQRAGVLTQLEFYALSGSSWDIPDPISLVPLI